MAIYFVQAGKGGPIKIGYTKRDAVLRVSNMQVGSPLEMILLSVIDGDPGQERDLHRRFKSAHMRGEWFSPVSDLMEFLGSLPPPPRQFIPRKYYVRGQRGPKEYVPATNRGRPRRLSDEKMEEIRKLIERTSEPITKIASRFGVHPSTILYHFPGLARGGEVRQGRESRLSRAQFVAIERALLETSDPITKIGKRYQVHPTTINYHFPRWRTKTKREREAHRKLRPLPLNGH